MILEPTEVLSGKIISLGNLTKFIVRIHHYVQAISKKPTLDLETANLYRSMMRLWEMQGKFK